MVRELAKRLKTLKEVFRFFCEKKRRLFTFDHSVMKMLEFEDNIEFQRLKSSDEETHCWYPLNPEDVWPPFIYCMMTVVDENNNSQKYQHIVFVEFCEYIARVAFIYHDVQRHNQMVDYENDKDSNHNEAEEMNDSASKSPTSPASRGSPNSGMKRNEQVSDFLDKLIARFKLQKKKKAK